MTSNNEKLDINYFYNGVLYGDRTILSQAITLAESSLNIDKEDFRLILKKILPHTGNSIRIGITGIPGVGKSTFIEVLGMYLIEKYKKKVAVLSIDPSSPINMGSILGDKVRMNELSRSDNAYIRPTPSKSKLGGVAENTRESLLLCEAAGYNVIFIETVGIGQSETTVHDMVDFLIMLQIAGAGDDLQTIKRGIFEKIDLLVLHKAEANNSLKQTEKEYHNFKQMFSFFSLKESNWTPRVVKCSSYEKYGFDDIWKIISDYIDKTKASIFFEKKRKDQNKKWYDVLVNQKINNLIFNDKDMVHEILKYRNQVSKESIEALNLSDKLIEVLKKKFN